MKRYKRLIALAVLLVVGCAATLAMTRYEEKQEQIRTAEEVVLEIPADSVTALSWDYEGEHLSFHKDGTWYYDDDEAFPVDDDKVGDILGKFEAFSVTFAIENVEDYSQYGLDEPDYTIHLTTETGSWDVKLGDFSKMDQQRYVDIGDGNVYLVSEDPMESIDPDISTMILDDTIPGWDAVTGITLAARDTTVITYAEDSTDTYNSAGDVYFLQSANGSKPLDTDLVEAYLDTLSGLSFGEYASYNVSDEELADFGLEDAELTVTVNYANTLEDETEEPGTLTLTIGQNQQELQAAREAEEAGEEKTAVTKYFRVGDSQIVYFLSDEDYETLSATGYDDLRHKEVFWAEFDTVYRLDITLEDQTHTLVAVTEDEETLWYKEADLPPETTEETTGETQTTEETAPAPESVDITDLKSALYALKASSFTQDAPGDKAELSMTIYLENDQFPQVELVLYRVDGTTCLACVDGQPVSFVTRGSVVTLVEAVQTIVLGG